MEMSSMILPLMTVFTGAMDYAAKGSAADAVSLGAARRKQGADFSADQLDVNAGQQIAASQRTAADKTRLSDLGLSRVQALAASQGGSTTDPTVMGIKAQIMAEGAYRAAMDVYQGSEAARGMRGEAAAQRFMGDRAVADAADAKRSSQISQYAGMAKTGTSIFGQMASAGGLMSKSAPSMGQKYNTGFDGAVGSFDMPPAMG
jgi:hypothetical protein